MKKILSIALALVLMLCILPMAIPTAKAAGGVKAKLDAVIAEYPDGTVWSDSFDGGIECYGFAKLVVYKVFGKPDQVVSGHAYRHWKYNGTPTNGMEVVGYITSLTAENIRNLLSNAKCGDVLQFDVNKQHSMIVYSVANDGVWVYDCNGLKAEPLRIDLRKFSYQEGWYVGRDSNKLTLLRATNYYEVDGSSPTEIKDYYELTAPDGFQRVRASDSTSSAHLGTLYTGDIVCITKYNADRSWGYLDNGVVAGWISLYYTKATTHTHSFKEWVVSPAATCTTAGVKTRTCNGCSQTETETIPATGHSFSSAYTVDTPATCTTAGSKSRHCTACGEKTDITAIPSTGHSFGNWYTEYNPTCTVGGTKRRDCACGAYETDVILATGHSYGDWYITKEATCANGGTKRRDCACGTFETLATPATEIHVYDNSNDATCNTCGGVREVTLNGWVEGSDGRFRYYENGNKITNAWRTTIKGYFYIDSDGKLGRSIGAKDGNTWYYVGSDGYRFSEKYTGWSECTDGIWRYFEKDNLLTNAWRTTTKGYFYLTNDGMLARSAWIKTGTKWYFVNTDGYRMINCWKADSKGWVYLGADGAMQISQWKKDSKGWCWLGTDGYIVKNNWVKDGGKWYFMDANGYMVSNVWKKDSKGWCYLGSDGAMKTNAWVKDSNGWCYVGANGYCVTNKWVADSKGWCYLNSNGNMVVNNWVYSGGNWYFMDANGYMISNTTKYWNGKTYYFNASGVCTNP